jgi:molybdate transport system ATP-binding protein
MPVVCLSDQGDIMMLPVLREKTNCIEMEPFIVLDRITTRLRDQFILKDTSWKIRQGEHWAIIGPNGSGKTSLARVLSGDLPVISGRRSYREGFRAAEDVAVVSFEMQRHLLARERLLEECRSFSGKSSDKTTPRMLFSQKIIPPQAGLGIERIAGLMKISHLLDRNIVSLSTGELRKIHVAGALLREPKMLILDEPFEGLDVRSREELKEMINRLIRDGVQVILVTHRLDAIPSEITHVLCLNERGIIAKGKREDILDSPIFQDLYARSRGSIVPFKGNHEPSGGKKQTVPKELIRMVAAKAAYGDHTIFKGLDWTVRRGENWMISGRNGAGKTTLLRMISGDHPQSYANEMYLFGKKRGTGESIWDIKEKMGLLSSEFQLRYRHPISATEVVLSGFFDSIGLYRKSDARQLEAARNWMRFLGIDHLREKPFTRLSFGEQKMVLIARAMVKSPVLLILDEPCQGLDPANRKMVLKLIDRIGGDPERSVLYVTHHPEEKPASIEKTLELERFSSPQGFP